MANPFDDLSDLGATARKVLEHDRQIRETLRSLGAPDQSTLAMQAIQHRSKIDRFIHDAGGIDRLREYMSTASAAQRAFNEAFPRDRLKELQQGFAQHTMLASNIGRDLATLAHTVGGRADAFAKLRSTPDVSGLLATARDAARTADIAAAIAAGSRIDASWASLSMPAASVGALAELTAFTARVRSAQPTDDARVVEIAEQFGDYDKAFASAETAETEDEREGVYTASGRNPTLIAFPVRAYPSVLVAAGWVSDFDPPPPPMLETGGKCEDAIHDPADGATITAVEAHLRFFIDSTLTLSHGPDWIKTLVPRDRIDAWRHRQKSSVAKGNPALTLIYYGDFQDLLDIICRKDLWRNVFAAVFGSKPLFEATMTRLHAVRLEIAHARPLTNTTRLRLEVEANAIFAALGVLRS